MRAALYARVSTAAQAEEDRVSLATQRAEFLRHCERKGYEPFPREYVDVMSGVREDRPEYQAMLADARAGKFDRIVARDVTRFGRDAEAAVLDMLLIKRETGVTVEFIHGRHRSLSDVVDDLEQGQQERERLSSRLRTSLVQLREQGKVLGTPPYGYRKEDGVLVPDDFEASIVLRIFREYVAGDGGMAAIARRLNEDGVATQRGTLWSQTVVGGVLANTTYVGRSQWGSTDDDGLPITGEIPCTPIIPADLFEQAQALRVRRQELHAPRAQGSGYLLAGLIYCGECGHRMKGWHPRRRSRRYRCADDGQDSCRPTWSVLSDEVEDAVVEFISDVMHDRTLVEDDGRERVELAERALQSAEDRLTQAQRRMDRAVDLYTEGRISDAEWDRQRARLEAAVSSAQSEVAVATAAHQQEQARIAHAEAIVSRAQSFTRSLRDGPIQTAKARLQTILSRVTVYRDERVEVTYL